MDNLYLGEIILFAGNFAPRNMAYCDGQLLAISQNQALFSLLGTTYGGDGRTTFALPDLRGRVPVHPGTGPGLSTRKLGQRSGTQTNTLTVNNMANHFHSTTVTAGTGGVVIGVSSADGDVATPTNGVSIAKALDVNGDEVNIYNNSAPDVRINTGSSSPGVPTVTVHPTGGQQPVNNMQPWLGVHYIICIQGLFPSRS